MIYQINGFYIDTLQFSLTLDGKDIPVEPKVFDLLVYLMQRKERLVTREELFETIWQGREVSDTTLSNSIKTARKILGDSAEKQAIIKTIRGRGYQFVAEVTERSVDNCSQTPSASPEAKTSSQPNIDNNNSDLLDSSNEKSIPKNNRYPIHLVSSFLVILGLAVFLAVMFSKNSEDSASAVKPYILVLPFEVSAENEETWRPFADQMTREVIRNLRKISGLRVVPTSSAFTFRDHRTPKNIIDKIPEVQFVLSATINVGNQSQIQVTAELEKLSNKKLVWDSQYSSRVDDTTFFSIKSEVATEVSRSLKVAILDQEKSTLGDLPTNNLRAYEYYVSGQQQKDKLTHQSLLKAIELYKQAIALDPKFEAAYIAKADAYRIVMVYFEKPSEALPNVIEAVAETLKINPDSAEARSSLGLAYVFAWRWQDAIDMLRQAKALNSNLVLTELGFALYNSAMGNTQEIHQSLDRANHIDPLNVELADWGLWALAMAGEVDKANQWGEEKMRLHPDVGLIFSSASMSASLTGDHQRAIELAQKGVELDAGISYPLLALAQAYGHAGQVEKVPELLNQVKNAESYLCDYEMAVAYLLIDQLDKTFEHLNRAVGYRSNCLIFTRNDPRLARIKEKTQYKSILKRVGLDDESLKKYSH